MKSTVGLPNLSLKLKPLSLRFTGGPVSDKVSASASLTMYMDTCPVVKVQMNKSVKAEVEVKVSEGSSTIA